MNVRTVSFTPILLFLRFNASNPWANNKNIQKIRERINGVPCLHTDVFSAQSRKKNRTERALLATIRLMGWNERRNVPPGHVHLPPTPWMTVARSSRLVVICRNYLPLSDIVIDSTLTQFWSFQRKCKASSTTRVSLLQFLAKMIVPPNNGLHVRWIEIYPPTVAFK